MSSSYSSNTGFPSKNKKDVPSVPTLEQLLKAAELARLQAEKEESILTAIIYHKNILDINIKEKKESIVHMEKELVLLQDRKTNLLNRDSAAEKDAVYSYQQHITEKKEVAAAEALAAEAAAAKAAAAEAAAAKALAAEAAAAEASAAKAAEAEAAEAEAKVSILLLTILLFIFIIIIIKIIFILIFIISLLNIL